MLPMYGRCIPTREHCDGVFNKTQCYSAASSDTHHAVGRNSRPGGQSHKISRHEQGRVNVGPLSVPHHLPMRATHVGYEARAMRNRRYC